LTVVDNTNLRERSHGSEARPINFDYGRCRDGAQAAAAQNRTAALVGQVTSDAEGVMEGVVVGAKKAVRPSRSARSATRRAATASRPIGFQRANIRSRYEPSAATSRRRQ